MAQSATTKWYAPSFSQPLLVIWLFAANLAAAVAVGVQLGAIQ